MSPGVLPTQAAINYQVQVSKRPNGPFGAFIVVSILMDTEALAAFAMPAWVSAFDRYQCSREQVFSALFTLSALVGPKRLFAKGRKDPQIGPFGPMVYGLNLVLSAISSK